jgi:hypothetical protein
MCINCATCAKHLCSPIFRASPRSFIQQKHARKNTVLLDFPLFSRRCAGLELMHTFLVPLAPALLRTPPRCAAQKCTQGVVGGYICAPTRGSVFCGSPLHRNFFFDPPPVRKPRGEPCAPSPGRITFHANPPQRCICAAFHPQATRNAVRLQRWQAATLAGWPLKAQSKPSVDKLRTPPSPTSFDKRSGAPGPASADPSRSQPQPPHPSRGPSAASPAPWLAYFIGGLGLHGCGFKGNPRRILPASSSDQRIRARLLAVVKIPPIGGIRGRAGAAFRRKNER